MRNGVSDAERASGRVAGTADRLLACWAREASKVTHRYHVVVGVGEAERLERLAQRHWDE